MNKWNRKCEKCFFFNLKTTEYLHICHKQIKWLIQFYIVQSNKVLWLSVRGMMWGRSKMYSNLCISSKSQIPYLHNEQMKWEMWNLFFSTSHISFGNCASRSVKRLRMPCSGSRPPLASSTSLQVGLIIIIIIVGVGRIEVTLNWHWIDIELTLNWH